MATLRKRTSLFVLCALFALNGSAFAAVSAQEAGQLKTTLTPLGAEKAGNKEGTIPAWTGGVTTPPPGWVDGKISDQFPNDKPLFSINAQNMAKYADKLSDGVKAMMKKYPDFRIDVYPTRRTAAAPQWVYDNTFKNATLAKLNGSSLKDAYGGIPFPIPQNGMQVMWNHILHWRGTAWYGEAAGIMGTANGQHVLVDDSRNKLEMPYYIESGSRKNFNGITWEVVVGNVAPPQNAGEALCGIQRTDPDKDATWIYLLGQRRVRRLPQACCDTPVATMNGMMTFDEVDGFGGAESLGSFNWKIVGKKEMYIPYNVNRMSVVPLSELLLPHIINPDYLRWELHRVWVVEATLRQGQRHTSPRSLYYIDEDTWNVALVDRFDANNKLWRMVITFIHVLPGFPATADTSYGFYGLLDGTFYMHALTNGEAVQSKVINPPYPQSTFTPDSLAGSGVR